MNESRFYHLALEKTLLGGKSVKQAIDAQLSEEHSEKRTTQTARSAGKEWNPRPIPWIAFPVAAMLLLSTLAIGITAGASGFRSRNQAVHPAAEAIMPSEAPAPSLDLVDEGYTIKLLPEFEPGLYDACVQWRKTHGGDPFVKEEWEWIRAMQFTVKEIGYRTDAARFTPSVEALVWTTTVQTDSASAFYTEEGVHGGQPVELGVGDATYTVEGDDTVYTLPAAGLTMENRTQSGWEELVYILPDSTPLPEKGRITLTETFYVIDYTVEDMQRYFGAVAEIKHTFSFNAEALSHPAAPEA